MFLLNKKHQNYNSATKIHTENRLIKKENRSSQHNDISKQLLQTKIENVYVLAVIVVTRVTDCH